MTSAIRLDSAGQDDLEEMLGFQRRQVAGTDPSPESLRSAVSVAHWFLFENPEARSGIPTGLIARNDAGAIVGAMHCSPQRFVVGENEHVLLCSGGYYVDRSYRGVGLRLMRALLDAAPDMVHFSSTMNEASGGIYERYGGYPIPHTEHEMIGVLRWPAVVEEGLIRRVSLPGIARFASWPSRLMPSRVRGSGRGRLVEMARRDEVDRSSIGTPAEHAAQVTSARAPEYLRWRYFDGPAKDRFLFRYESEEGRSALVAIQLGRRGHRGQIRALTVLDYFGAVGREAIVDVARLLVERFRGEADMLIFRGQPPDRQEQLMRAGFMRRLLPRAIGVCIDVASRLHTRDWYMVPADGDMSV